MQAHSWRSTWMGQREVKWSRYVLAMGALALCQWPETRFAFPFTMRKGWIYVEKASVRYHAEKHICIMFKGLFGSDATTQYKCLMVCAHQKWIVCAKVCASGWCCCCCWCVWRQYSSRNVFIRTRKTSNPASNLEWVTCFGPKKLTWCEHTLSVSNIKVTSLHLSVHTFVLNFDIWVFLELFSL